MVKIKKTWREKINEIKEKIYVITPEWEERYGKGKILIPSALDIEKVILKTRRGQLITNDIIRSVLAKEKKVRLTDPITVGIFLRIIAEAAEEERKTKKKKVTPYWRVLKPDGSINIKFPGGAEKQSSFLKAEGHKIEPGKGKKPPRIISYPDSIKKVL